MIIAALALAAQLANPGFERGLEGWRVERHRGMGVGLGTNRGYTIPQAAEGEQDLTMGWRARNSAPRDARVRVSTCINARPYRGRRIRVSAQTRAPGFAAGAGSLSILTDGNATLSFIPASDGWQERSIELRVPRLTRRIEIIFQAYGTAAELAVDDVRLEILR